jgi:hypothetical protein
VNVFGPHQRAQLAGDARLSIYESLTTDQVIGLLDACANYLARRAGLTPDELALPTLAPAPDVVAAHRALVECCRGLWLEPGEPLPQRHESLVFTVVEQEELRLHKYVRGFERITHLQLLDLLRAVRNYSEVGVVLPLWPDSMIMNRYFHAHNWVIRFGQEPFTDAEFVEDLHHTVFESVLRSARKLGRPAI